MAAGFAGPEGEKIAPESAPAVSAAATGKADPQQERSVVCLAAGHVGEEEGLLHELTKTTRNQVRVLKHLLAKERYDFVMTVFDGIDTASHSLWKYLDTNHPKYDAKLAEQGRKAFYRSYGLADEAIGEVLGEAGRHTRAAVGVNALPLGVPVEVAAVALARVGE